MRAEQKPDLLSEVALLVRRDVEFGLELDSPSVNMAAVQAASGIIGRTTAPNVWAIGDCAGTRTLRTSLSTIFASCTTIPMAAIERSKIVGAVLHVHRSGTGASGT